MLKYPVALAMVLLGKALVEAFFPDIPISEDLANTLALLLVALFGGQAADMANAKRMAK